MDPLRICLFGKFQVYNGDDPLPGFESRRVQELLSYLLLHSDRTHPREVLAGLLWGERPARQAKKYLRQALWQLQNALDPHLPDPAPPVLLVDSDWLQLNPAAPVSCDALQFETAFSFVRGIPGRELSPAQQEILQENVSLYKDDLLIGWYQDWCFFHRERLQNLYLTMLDKLMGHCEFHQAYEAGIEYGSHILAVDNARERAHRRLMRLHYLIGNRTAALRQYQRCAAALQKELGVEPARSTRRVYQQIRADRLVDTLVPSSSEHTSPNGQSTPPQKTTSSSPESLSRLKQLQALLSEFQTQLRRQIQAAEAEEEQNRPRR